VSSADIGASHCAMLRLAPSDAFAPALETAQLQLAAHDGDDRRLIETELEFDSLKGGSIFPGHFNNS